MLVSANFSAKLNQTFAYACVSNVPFNSNDMLTDKIPHTIIEYYIQYTCYATVVRSVIISNME